MIKDIMKTKTASVWGVGYLGYTTMLKLQNSGFNIIAHDLNRTQLREFAGGDYPDKERIAAWSEMGYLPRLDYKRIRIAAHPKEMFKESRIHIIAIPERIMTARVAAIFAGNLKNRKTVPLILFESAFVPGQIEKEFAARLKKEHLISSRDYYLGALFRTDWSVEAFIRKSGRMPIAGDCAKSYRLIKELFDYLGVATVSLGSIKEAEIYANSINAIQAMASDFVRQLAIGYPSVNVKKLSGELFRNISLDGCMLNIGTGGTRMTYAIDHLIQGSGSAKELTLLKEFQNINISSVLSYAEYIMRHSYKKVAILGVTYKGNQKDLTLSPSVTLANYLIKNSVKVMLNDPICSKNELMGLVKGARAARFPEEIFRADAIVVASDHNEYKYLSQSVLDGIKKDARLIIDNYGIWSNLAFSKRIKYHQVGDGTLNLSR